ncbi:MAG TPA: hypothetical protein ENH52_12685 [Nitrospirae bacterium]|nr:hypothetical protein [Nitrospirota bacterium]
MQEKEREVRTKSCQGIRGTTKQRESNPSIISRKLRNPILNAFYKWIDNIVIENMESLRNEIIENRKEIRELKKYISSFGVKFPALADYEDEAKKKFFGQDVNDIISEIERFNNNQLSDKYIKEILGQIIEKKVYVQVDDSQKEEFFAKELYENKIPFDSFYNPRENKTSYRISNKAYNYFVQKGLALNVIKVKNIGDLSVEERNKIKRYHKSQTTKNRKKVLDELRSRYGPINEES